MPSDFTLRQRREAAHKKANGFEAGGTVPPDWRYKQPSGGRTGKSDKATADFLDQYDRNVRDPGNPQPIPNETIPNGEEK